MLSFCVFNVCVVDIGEFEEECDDGRDGVGDVDVDGIMMILKMTTTTS